MQKTPEQIAALIEEIKEARRTKERAKPTDRKPVTYKNIIRSKVSNATLRRRAAP